MFGSHCAQDYAASSEKQRAGLLRQAHAVLPTVIVLLIAKLCSTPSGTLTCEQG